MKIILTTIILQGVAIGTVQAHMCDDRALVTSVLKHANIKPTEGALIDCKGDPSNNTAMIMAYANWISETTDDVAGHYDLNILKFDKVNDKVTYHYKVADELISDAVNLDSIQLDTANYKINDSNRALGLRLNYSGHSQPNPFSMTVFNLYDIENKKQILKSLIVDQYQAETDTRCNADIKERKSTLVMQNTKSYHYYDIQVNSKIDHYQMNGTSDKCLESKHKLSQHRFLLKFDGQQYQIPKIYRDDYLY